MILSLIGVILIVGGGVSLFYRGIPYTSRDVVLDVGPVTATTESEKTWPISPILGGLAIAGGVLLLIAGNRKA
jgi:hypothetical protein